MRRFPVISVASACMLLWLVRDAGRARQPENEAAKLRTIHSGVAQTVRNDSGPAEYYVDCGNLKTTGNGRSPESAWHSLDAVNAHTFLPGDIIRLKRGTECHGILWPKGSGSSSATIRLSAYETGARPKVVAGKGDEEAFKLFDQQYWDVDSIEFSGGTFFGVYVSGQTGILHHIHLRNLLVHDVRGGEVKHKESGLIVISPGMVHQHFDDVLVDGISAYDTDQWAGILVGGGNFGEVAEEDWSTHVVVRNSIVHDVYGDGIILFRVKDGLIDASAAWYTGMQPTQTIGTPNAIWTWMCKDCVVSNNEAFLTDSPGVDGGAFDIDYGNSHNSVISNFGHDTQGYCIAVFGAGYVTHDSAVEGNLCVNNGQSPRMARQGAIYLFTWNNGVIENLRVEKNTVFWYPPGNFPALLNHGDIRGSQALFQQNEIYSSSPWMIDSYKNLTLQRNRYVSCGSDHATWTFGDKSYHTFEAYRRASGQDRDSSWTPDSPPVSCLLAIPEPVTQAAASAKTSKSETPSRANTSAGWTIVSEIPAAIDRQALLDSASLRQLAVLKNQYLQFRASGLRLVIALGLQHGGAEESEQNAIRDFSLSGIEISTRAVSDSSRARTRLLSPGGVVVKEWKDIAGPTEIGPALRKALGSPFYSQLRSSD